MTINHFAINDTAYFDTSVAHTPRAADYLLKKRSALAAMCLSIAAATVTIASLAIGSEEAQSFAVHRCTVGAPCYVFSANLTCNGTRHSADIQASSKTSALASLTEVAPNCAAVALTCQTKTVDFDGAGSKRARAGTLLLAAAQGRTACPTSEL